MSKYGFDLLLEQLLEDVAGEFDWQRQEAKGDTEIERLLFLAVSMRIRFGACELTELLVPTDERQERAVMEIENAVAAPKHCRLIMRPQAQMGDRRVDFLVHAYDWRDLDPSKWTWRKLIVECDGHAFHERTKEQAARDRSKDRRAVLDGIDCFRFTGSELWRDPWGCAEQITDWAVKGWG